MGQWLAGLAGLLLAGAVVAQPDEASAGKVVLPAAMQAAVADFTACVTKDKRTVLPLSDKLVRQNLCGVYLPYDAAQLRWFKKCLRAAKPVEFERDARILGDQREFSVRLRCARRLPDLWLDIQETEKGLVVRRVGEVVS